MDSNRITVKAYRALGPDYLAGQATAKGTRDALSLLQKEIRGAKIILDVGCGYGRLAIPLAQKGLAVWGIDLSAEMIAAAKKGARKGSALFRKGDMKKLPYPANRFDAVICMWSTLNHLLKPSEQVTALKEMHRVLQKGGVAIVETVDGGRFQKMLQEEGYGPGGRIADLVHRGTTVPTYIHDANTLRALARKTRFGKCRIQKPVFGKKRRLVAILAKKSA